MPDILLIDEALAVGDKDFKERSMARVKEIRDQAGTVVMVTHSLAEIRQSCARAVWLEQGVLKAEGTAEDVIAAYEGTG